MNRGSGRRRFVAGASAFVLSLVAGCSSDEGNGNGDGSGDADDEGQPAREPTDSATEEATEAAVEESSVFKNIALEETDLIVELEEDRAEELTQIRVDFPDDTEQEEVTGGLTKYRFSLVRGYHVYVRAGEWAIHAVDSNYDSFESVEFVTETNVSVSDVGTLDELGETGESTADEHNTFQVTFTNEGPMPVGMSPGDTWDFEYTQNSPNRAGGRVVVQSDDLVLTAGESTELRYLLVRDVEDVKGETYQGALNINWQPDGQTVVLLRAEFGDTVKRDSNGHKYIEETSVSRRDG